MTRQNDAARSIPSLPIDRVRSAVDGVFTRSRHANAHIAQSWRRGLAAMKRGKQPTEVTVQAVNRMDDDDVELAVFRARYQHLQCRTIAEGG